jgi:hypothetical protein
MPSNPPNWQWCQSATAEERENFYKKNPTKSLQRINKAVEPVEFYDELPEIKSDYAACVIPATSDAAELLEITRDAIVKYAKKCGADYIELTGNQNENWPMSNKYRVEQIAKVYKKTLYLDCDIVVRHDSPNIFITTPDDKISAYDEWEIWESRKDTEWIIEEQKIISNKMLGGGGSLFVTNKMLNGGVLVIPQRMAHYYKQPTSVYPKQWCFDQNYLTLTLPEDKLNRLSYKFNCEYADQNFYSKQKESYFVHINNIKRSDSEKRIDLLKKISNYVENIDSDLWIHEDISTSKKYHSCSFAIKRQKNENIKLKKYIIEQQETKHTANDVSILCLGHKKEQFDSIKPRTYLKNINLNTIDAGEFSGNEWAEARVFLSKNNLFDLDAKFYGMVTASWNMKYYSQCRIDDFHNWFSAKVLLNSKPEDRVVLCADMYCWCNWLNDKTCYNNNRVINSIMDKDYYDNKLILRNFLRLINFNRKIHKRVPFSNQIICHKHLFQDLVNEIKEKDIAGKIKWFIKKHNIVKHLSYPEGHFKNILNYSLTRVEAYFFEVYTIAWFTTNDCKIISNTTRLENWYSYQSMTKRIIKNKSE